MTVCCLVGHSSDVLIGIDASSQGRGRNSGCVFLGNWELILRNRDELEKGG